MRRIGIDVVTPLSHLAFKYVGKKKSISGYGVFRYKDFFIENGPCGSYDYSPYDHVAQTVSHEISFGIACYEKEKAFESSFDDKIIHPNIDDPDRALPGSMLFDPKRKTLDVFAYAQQPFVDSLWDTLIASVALVDWNLHFSWVHFPFGDNLYLNPTKEVFLDGGLLKGAVSRISIQGTAYTKKDEQQMWRFLD